MISSRVRSSVVISILGLVVLTGCTVAGKHISYEGCGSSLSQECSPYILQIKNNDGDPPEKWTDKRVSEEIYKNCDIGEEYPNCKYG